MEEIKIFKALSNQVRMDIFKLLMNGKMCVSGIVNKLNISQPAVTQHLKILQDAGLVKSQKLGYWMHYYIDKQGLEDVINTMNGFIGTLHVKSSECDIKPSECPEKARK